MLDIQGTTEECTVLEGVGITVLVCVEEFKEVLAFGCFEVLPSFNGFRDEMPVRVEITKGIDEGCLSSTNVALDRDENVRKVRQC
jgi:hypothetical protein